MDFFASFSFGIQFWMCFVHLNCVWLKCKYRTNGWDFVLKQIVFNLINYKCCGILWFSVYILFMTFFLFYPKSKLMTAIKLWRYFTIPLFPFSLPLDCSTLFSFFFLFISMFSENFIGLDKYENSVTAAGVWRIVSY